MASDVEVLFENASGRVVRQGDVYVQARWGMLTIASLDRMLAVFREAERSTPAGQRLFAVFVVEPDADVPTADVRARQKEVLAELGSSGRLSGIVVIEGHGALAHLARSNMSKMSPDTVCVADAADAARAIVRARGTGDGDDILRLIAAARRR